MDFRLKLGFCANKGVEDSVKTSSFSIATYHHQKMVVARMKLANAHIMYDLYTKLNDQYDKRLS